MDETQRRQEALQSLDQMGLIIRATQAQLRLERQPSQFLDGLIEQFDSLKAEFPGLTDEELYGRLEAVMQSGEAAANKLRTDIDNHLNEPA